MRTARIRLTILAMSALVLGGIAAAPAQAGVYPWLKVVKSKYKIKMTGTYTDEWKVQGINHPSPDEYWVLDKGKVVSDFKTRKPWKAQGLIHKEDLAGIRMKFEWSPPHLPALKADTRAQFNTQINQIAYCGGELGECDDGEVSELKTETGKCRKPGRSLTVAFEFDSDGIEPNLGIDFENHGSLTEFCGRKYNDKHTVDRLPEAGTFRMPKGLDVIRNLDVGKSLTGSGRDVVGLISGDGNPSSPRFFKNCPPMDGVGLRECWTTDYKIKITRVK